jgi:hypothetical protein
LALTIFDLGKITLEEEVLLYKDILRHSSTRRTITRFIKRGGEHIIEAALLLVSLGVYVYLGSNAEGMLLKNNVNTRKMCKGGMVNQQ